MAINKVIYNNETLIDLTNDTVTSGTLLSGTTSHNAKGEIIVGSVQFKTIYTGNTTPTDDLGNDGDVYIVIGG